MPTVTIRPGEGNEETIPKTLGYERTREIGGMRRVLIDVDRRDAQAVTLNRKDDTIQLGSIDTVRLVDIETGGPVWTLVCYSFEWDANRAGFTDGGDLRQGDDQTLITNLVGEVPSWSAGTINSFTGALSFVFNHAHRHEAIRRIEKNVPGEIQFRDEGTVDYVSELGTDRSGSVELSASAGTIEDQITITERGRELDGTHIRVLGAHEGEAQLFANLVPSDDSGTYTNRVNYTTSRWSDGDPKDWDRWENKDVTDQATIEEEAAALGDELDETLVEAETTVTTVSLEVGDFVQVKKPDANLDKTMRVHRVVEKSGRRNDTDSGATVVQDVLLSTRTILRTDDASDLRDIQRFNTAFQGSAMWGTVAGGVQAVNSSLNYTLPFFYPDVDFEHLVELQIKSVPYRVFHSGGAASSSNVVTSSSGVILSDLNQNNDIPSRQILLDGDSYTLTFTPNDPSSYFTARVEVSTDWATDVGGPTVDYDLEFFHAGGFIHDENNRRSYNYADFYEQLVDTFSIDDTADFDVTWTNRDGETHDLDTGTGVDLDYYGDHTHDVDPADHTHPVDPGITEFPAETASNVDVIVNGNTEATNVASGEFETTVDISDTLTKGAWNTVEVTSDSLGVLICTLAADVYRQVGST